MSWHNEYKGKIMPISVIFIGHLMGGFIARTIVVHPNVKKDAVETIFTFFCPL
jgi:hypothetical protein